MTWNLTLVFFKRWEWQIFWWIRHQCFPAGSKEWFVFAFIQSGYFIEANAPISCDLLRKFSFVNWCLGRWSICYARWFSWPYDQYDWRYSPVSLVWASVIDRWINRSCLSIIFFHINNDHVIAYCCILYICKVKILLRHLMCRCEETLCCCYPRTCTWWWLRTGYGNCMIRQRCMHINKYLGKWNSAIYYYDSRAMHELPHQKFSSVYQNWPLELSLVLEVFFTFINIFFVLATLETTNQSSWLFKGTQRLPRLVGISKAIDMLLVSLVCIHE